MIIVCITDDKENWGLTQLLKPSCVHHNLKLKVLTYKKEYSSHRIKDLLLFEYLQKINNNEIVLLTDAFDTMFISDEQEILSKYYEFNSPIVFSSEIVCYPDSTLGSKYPPLPNSHFKYLNSGGFIGKAETIMNLMEKYYSNDLIDLENFGWSNQHVWHQIYLKEQDVIKLDTKCEIFYTLCSALDISYKYTTTKDAYIKNELLNIERNRLMDEMSFKNERFQSSITNRFPCHLHFNSPTTKDLMTKTFFDSLKPWL